MSKVNRTTKERAGGQGGGQGRTMSADGANFCKVLVIFLINLNQQRGGREKERER